MFSEVYVNSFGIGAPLAGLPSSILQRYRDAQHDAVAASFLNGWGIGYDGDIDTPCSTCSSISNTCVSGFCITGAAVTASQPTALAAQSVYPSSAARLRPTGAGCSDR